LYPAPSPTEASHIGTCSVSELKKESWHSTPLSWKRVRLKGEEVVERRKHKRFHAKDGTFAVLRPQWPYSTKIGQIIDISMGGLAFSDVAGEDQPNRSYELDILLAEHSFHLTKIPFETIWDQEAEQLPSSTLSMRRCGVQFGELTRNQKSQLEYFVWHYTTP
jgi:hypothetical protein